MRLLQFIPEKWSSFIRIDWPVQVSDMFRVVVGLMLWYSARVTSDVRADRNMARLEFAWSRI
ncbi:hypothetical protein Brsp06_01314 [Brucella sp. NBRC 13694]|uniref:Uncharacterized protein n=2 Tax=Brucella TaxID=234 RepID=A0A256GRE0_9HYPH|nr:MULTISPECIES: hypothetical protein [Brucella]NIH75954.1 hypothetical protein [Ochrobactrum sp. P20RRXII]NKC47730.1 hypothetical protein [Brucella anthropi ATCC 49188]OYR29717.1 hypothetical protein CES86_2281 [Brucella lupini]AIK44869.1 hypothetical protein DR92_285 [Brucella anthropi]EXL07824.1 hypothetical protein BG46_12315 [Brucella anthropi]